MNLISIGVIFVVLSFDAYSCHQVINEANSLFSRLFVYGNYNKHVLPVQNFSEPVVVKMDLKLSQLIELDVKEERLKVSVWVQQTWFDSKLVWNPEDYGGLMSLEVPSEDIWLPDLVLHNNLDGNLGVGTVTKATMYHNGLIKWSPPIHYNIGCGVDVEYFPFDQQTCSLKFASWTYDGSRIYLQHMRSTPNSSTIERGIDLSDFYPSVEWDITGVPAIRTEKYYTCCEDPYLDIVFSIEMTRKTLHSTMLMIPLILISFLTTLVFILPSNSGEKMPLFAAILISYSVFFCILAETIPPTSIIISLIGKYIIFTFLLLTSAVAATVLTVNIHYRSPATHEMGSWVHFVFLKGLPKILCMRRRKRKTRTPAPSLAVVNIKNKLISAAASLQHDEPIPQPRDFTTDGGTELKALEKKVEDMAKLFSTMLGNVGRNVESISNYVVHKEENQEVQNDWKFVAYVLDRLFFWIFTFVWWTGTLCLVLKMTHHSSNTQPILEPHIVHRRGN